MPDLTDHDTAVLVELLVDTIKADRFPLSPKIKRLKRSWRRSIRHRHDRTLAADEATTGDRLAQPP
jgi:hypothetical protein